MDEQNKELKTIALEYLLEGMTLSEDVYNHNGSLLLLSKGIHITEGQICQLREFNSFQRNISVPKDTYDQLIKGNMSPFSVLAQEYMEKTTGYTEIKEKAGEMLEDVTRTQTIDKEDVYQIADEMLAKLKEIDPALIFQCINAPNPIDEYLQRHSVNVGLLNGMIGRWMQLEAQVIEQLIVVGLVHDVGKTKIPIDIVDAPRKLTHSEFEVMKMHPIYSYELLSGEQRFTEDMRLAARHHHEKMNGDGYPDGLVADDISLLARITALSDIYDAMVSKRSYKDAVNPFSVISKLAKQQFSQLDMRLVKLFMIHMPMELVGKSVLMSDGSIGIVRFITKEDLENPLVEINGTIKKTDDSIYCKRVIFDE